MRPRSVRRSGVEGPEGSEAKNDEQILMRQPHIDYSSMSEMIVAAIRGNGPGQDARVDSEKYLAMNEVTDRIHRERLI